MVSARAHLDTLRVEAAGARTFLSAAMCYARDWQQIRAVLAFGSCCGQECPRPAASTEKQFAIVSHFSNLSPAWPSLASKLRCLFHAGLSGPALLARVQSALAPPQSESLFYWSWPPGVCGEAALRKAPPGWPPPLHSSKTSKRSLLAMSARPVAVDVTRNSMTSGKPHTMAWLSEPSSLIGTVWPSIHRARCATELRLPSFNGPMAPPRLPSLDFPAKPRLTILSASSAKIPCANFWSRSLRVAFKSWRPRMTRIPINGSTFTVTRIVVPANGATGPGVA